MTGMTMPTAAEHEALRLADRVEAMAQTLPAYGFVTTPLVEAAAELRRLHALTQTGGWQDIASAPKDGSHVHLYAPELQFVGFYADACGWCYVAPGCPLAPTQPTAWRPLPPSPAAERAQERGQ